MRPYTANDYRDLIEETDNPTLRAFMEDEKKFIVGVTDIKSRTAVDLGAGNGRVEGFLSGLARDVVAIEINPNMYEELECRAADYTNVTTIKGDFLNLSSIIPDNIKRPVFLILLNTLGTIEGGNETDVLDVVMKTARQQSGELILTLFRQQALEDYGVKMYAALASMVGNVDMDKSDFKDGLMVTDTGYTSKWWTDTDIAKISSLGKVIRESHTNEYWFLQLA